MLLLPSDKIPALNENHPSSDMVKNDVDVGKHPLRYDDDDDIYHYPRKLRWAKNRLAKMHDGKKSIQFLDKLKLIGLSDARICYYSDRQITAEKTKWLIHLASHREDIIKHVTDVSTSCLFCAYPVEFANKEHAASHYRWGHQKSKLLNWALQCLPSTLVVA